MSLLTGLNLAQVGEFSFILATVGVPMDLMGPEADQVFIGIAVLSMLTAPFVIMASRPLTEGVCRFFGKATMKLQPYDAGEPLEDHVIMVGYGLNGRNRVGTRQDDLRAVDEVPSPVRLISLFHGCGM